MISASISTAPVQHPRLPYSGKHIIASVRGSLAGPTLVILGGIHGNEPAGVLAIDRVLPRIKERKALLRGDIVLLRGNTRALEQEVRYIEADLNRQWTAAQINDSRPNDVAEMSEILEQRELLLALKEAVSQARGDVYFVDLHTTSAAGKPFATVGDTIRNRRFALKFPVLIVLGLEEQIDGTLLEFINNRGAITMGFEAGQHKALTSVDNHEALIWLATVAAGNFDARDIHLERYRSQLKHASGGSRVVEVRHRHAISAEDEFEMEPGYRNFQPIKRGQLLAKDRRGEITACETGLILMPLYQKLGDDGFFLGREVKQFWMLLSALLRKLKIGNYVHLLPGVRRAPLDENLLIVNTRIARILPLQIFHLLGFRRRRWVDNDLVVSRRAYDVVGPANIIL
jgi:succinylglutamate desuccinylase